MKKPKRYDMSEPEDIKRWFREMEGYLKCGSETKHDFLNQGTDFDGRCFAMDGFRQLRMIMFKKINSETQASPNNL
ncbi:hypothetical protein GF336_00315 [Candidatus Woesearchaeota archaeon]|nr:hypothetical protein [Candidatus Woesearchaeota archaeon]